MDLQQVYLCACVEKYIPQMRAAQQFLWQHPETGYHEQQTNEYMKRAFRELGYSLYAPEDITGFYTDIDTGRPGPRILVLCELDALPCPDHPDSVAGNAHACGHHAQCAAMLGLAGALREENALADLSGSIRLMAVPAEEMVELSWREELRRAGIIRFYGGKPEFMRRGYFDGVDLAFMIHTMANDASDFVCNIGHNGFLAKEVTFLGKAAHAGSAPEQGINALYAAKLALQAINDLRETFEDDCHIRVHPIITGGGASVNMIPSRVTMETYVRAASMDAIRDVNRRVNRAIFAAAAALGVEVSIEDRPGYGPMHNDPALMDVASECMTAIVGAERVNFRNFWSKGSTDMGDVSCVLPAIHAYACGAVGTAHGKDFRISSFERAIENSAKAQALIVHTLLVDDARRAREITAQYVPKYPSITAYLDEIGRLFTTYRSTISGNDSEWEAALKAEQK